VYFTTDAIVDFMFPTSDAQGFWASVQKEVRELSLLYSDGGLRKVMLNINKS
jgi:hypothetical protein